MTKQEFIDSNQYLRKGMKNLSDEDLMFMADIGQGKVDPVAKENLLKIKQVVYHMQQGMSLWEMRGLLKAFRTLSKLSD